ncbi:MAG TPA: DNA-binding protein [Aquifex aeolicus]|nr:DNA-binding protein [Aquifex aeolicus]
MSDKFFYTVKELADMLGCSEENVRQLARKGLLPARKWKKRIIFLRKELEEYFGKLPYLNPRCKDGAF